MAIKQLSRPKAAAGGKKASTVPTLPGKTTINLAMTEKKGIKAKVLTLYVVLLALVMLAVAKFAVIDQFTRLDAAQSAYETAHTTYTDVQNELSGYDGVEREYERYSREWLEDTQSEDYVWVSREKVLDLVEQSMMSVGTVKEFTLLGSTLTVKMSEMNLEQIASMFSVLDNNEIVNDIQLNIAQTEDNSQSASLDFSMTITLAGETEAQGQ